MKPEKRLRARDYILGLAANGHYHFSSSEAQSALGLTPAAAKLALNRLAKQGLIASPAQSFYVVVPPEYHSLGCLPADQFVPQLMKRLGVTYYTGLLSAAQYHGAAHHRPQEYQVMVAKPRRPMVCGKVRVAFVGRKNIGEIPVQSFNTPRGNVLVSTPEATAIDLIGYYSHVGGLDQVATILGELAEKLDPNKLVFAAQIAPISWAQRLGYLLERVDAGSHAQALKTYVRTHVRQATVLLPSAVAEKSQRDEGWMLDINADVEAEF